MINIIGVYFIVCESKGENLISVGWRRDFLWVMDHWCWENPLIKLTQQNICEILHSFGAVLGKRVTAVCLLISFQVPFPFPSFGFFPNHSIENPSLYNSVFWILWCFMQQIVSEILNWICFPVVRLARYQRCWMNLSIFGEKTVFTVPFLVLVSIKIFPSF